MKLKILETVHSQKKFRIVGDHPEAGAYLYIYEGEKCIKDYLQNDIEMCKQFAFEDYDVPLDAWVPK